MNERDKELTPANLTTEEVELGLSPTSPQDFGLPQKPTIQQLTAWHNQERFLKEFAKHGRKIQAAESIGLTVWAVERWDSTDLYCFRKRYQIAKENFLERYEASCDEDALIGVEKPVMHKGEVVLKPDGTPYTYRVRDSLTRMFRMKRLDPAYKDNYQPQQVQDNRSVTIINNYPSGPRQLTGSIDAEVRELPESEKN